MDFAAQSVDIGVRYGTGRWPGLVSTKLMDEEVYPVCSPKFLSGRRLTSATALLRETLIHDLSMDERAGFPTWHTWLAKAGVKSAHAETIATARGLKINNSAAVLQAAIEGQGVALARSAMAHDDVAAGRLVRLLPKIRFESALAYSIVHRKDALTQPRVMAFRDWLLEEAGKNLA
jgi:LysR family transcriptional regulator, glycine cleavage system transcriptional activator